MDYDHWDEVGTILGKSEGIKQILDDLMKLRVRMGAIPLGMCIQYLLGDFLMPGDHFSWTGSAGVVFANSILGARGNMDGIVTNYAVAITGKVPEYGLHTFLFLSIFRKKLSLRGLEHWHHPFMSAERCRCSMQ